MSRARFYTAVDICPVEGGHALRLDGRRIRTPAGRPLEVPALALAQAMAAEWAAQARTIRPETMPLTGLANAALDRVAPQMAQIAAEVAAYGAHDLVCYRADRPARLVARQQATFDPLLDWAADTMGARLQPVTGVMPVAQEPAALAALAEAVRALPPFELTAISAAVRVLGSLVLGLALHAGRLDTDAAFAASRLDETTQEEDWGTDAEAAARAARMAGDLAAAARFLALLRGSPAGL